MKLRIGISPCPNDTFIFDALLHHKIDTMGITFEPLLEDVQTLNEWAIQGRLDISKISYGTLPLVQNNYAMLRCGGALGKGVGPLLIAPYNTSDKIDDNATVAIPGSNTTAHVLFTFAFPNVHGKRFMSFDKIEQAVLQKEVDYGVIIHEGRFTYAAKGLHKVLDLGAYWESKLHVPIPLGCIVVKKTFAQPVLDTLELCIQKSLVYAQQQLPTLPPFVYNNAQEMSETTMRSHIDLYVNTYSHDLGEDGLQAVKKFEAIFHQRHV